MQGQCFPSICLDVWFKKQPILIVYIAVLMICSVPCHLFIWVGRVTLTLRGFTLMMCLMEVGFFTCVSSSPRLLTGCTCRATLKWGGSSYMLYFALRKMASDVCTFCPHPHHFSVWPCIEYNNKTLNSRLKSEASLFCVRVPFRCICDFFSCQIHQSERMIRDCFKGAAQSLWGTKKETKHKISKAKTENESQHYRNPDIVIVNP